MKKEKIVKRLGKAVKSHQMCDVNLTFDEEHPRRCLPFKSSEELFLYAKDGDVLSNGFVVRRVKDILKIKTVDAPVDKTMESKEIAIISQIRLDNWAVALEDLEEHGKVVVVETEETEGDDGFFAVGKIVKIGKKRVGIQYYGPDKQWEGKKWKVPYEEITRVSVASRYTSLLNQYVPEGKHSGEGFEDLNNEE